MPKSFGARGGGHHLIRTDSRVARRGEVLVPDVTHAENGEDTDLRSTSTPRRLGCSGEFVLEQSPRRTIEFVILVVPPAPLQRSPHELSPLMPI